MRRRAQFESLQARQMLTVQAPVDTLLDVVDAGDLYYSLREVINHANMDTEVDTIKFAPGLTGTIELSGSQLTTSNNLTVEGRVPHCLTDIMPRNPAATSDRLNEAGSGIGIGLDVTKTVSSNFSPNTAGADLRWAM